MSARTQYIIERIEEIKKSLMNESPDAKKSLTSELERLQSELVALTEGQNKKNDLLLG